jgi:hypothetical protein
MPTIFIFFNIIYLFFNRHVLASSDPCCQNLDEPIKLISCIENSDVLQPMQSNISFVSFTSDDILSYSAFTFLLNSIYGRHKKYSMKLLREADGDYHPQDKRWNKIGAVLAALNPINGWARNTDYIVAIDADLVVVDYSLDIAQLGAQHPSAHLILSTDHSDIGNTGFMIIKNTKWARDFFGIWWDMRYSFDCDQHALNDLYGRLQQSNKSRKRVAVLPAGEINTEFPIYANFDSNRSRVLHMVGEKNNVREEVFRAAATHHCTDPSLAGYGITQQSLRVVASRIKEVELSESIATCRATVDAAVASSSVVFAEASATTDDSFAAASDEQWAKVTAIDDCMQTIHEKTNELCRLISNGYNRAPSDTCADQFFDNYEFARGVGEALPLAGPSMYDFTTKNLHDSFLHMKDSKEAVARGEQVR